MTLNWLRDAEEAAERQDAEIAQRREDESDMPEFMKNWN